MKIYENCLNLEDNAEDVQKVIPVSIAAVTSVSLKKENKLNLKFEKETDDKSKNVAKETAAKRNVNNN